MFTVSTQSRFGSIVDVSSHETMEAAITAASTIKRRCTIIVFGSNGFAVANNERGKVAPINNK